MTVWDERFMSMALAMGARGLGQVWPNPSVGCVIVKDQYVLGRGVTQIGGRPHAEVMALRQAGAAARGATAYVTLEPCAHHGKSPPCAEALIAAGLARVVVAIVDPDPRVSGKGLQLLQQAGLQTECGVMEAEARKMHWGFLSRITKKRPMLTLKLATSFDGRIATANGDSKWITGPLARRQVHLMRAKHDAVLVGGNTARLDDPRLTVRDMGHLRQPVRVVASKKLNIPQKSALAQSARETPLWLMHGADCDPSRLRFWEEQGAHLFECPLDGQYLDMGAMLQKLGAAGLTRIYCEGGGTLAASLLQADLVDILHSFTAGLPIGAEGQPGLGPLGLVALKSAPRFDLESHQRFGDDLLHIWHRRSAI